MRINRLRLDNWRNFRAVDAPLQKRVFLVGPNASGKSNFLDSLRFLQDLAIDGGGLREAVNRRRGVAKIRCLAARRPPDVAIKAEIVDDSEKSAVWTYHVVFNQDNNSRPIVKQEFVARGGETLLQRPDKDDRADPERLTQTHLEQVNANKEFRPIVELFRSIRYLHIVPQLVRDPGRYVAKDKDPFGGDFLEQVVRTTPKTASARFRAIAAVLQAAVPQLKEVKIERDETTGEPHLMGRFENWRPGAGWQREDQFSDGTLRMIGLLWAVFEGSGPLLLEEPELSLHAGVIRHLPQMFAKVARKKGRQIIISTHSPELLSDPGIAPDEVLMLQPDAEGTRVGTAANDAEIVALLEGGLSIADVVIPKTAPPNAEQLAFSFESD
jgi:predicted ATPase